MRKILGMFMIMSFFLIIGGVISFAVKIWYAGIIFLISTFGMVGLLGLGIYLMGEKKPNKKIT
jgi:hypothetical protein